MNTLKACKEVFIRICILFVFIKGSLVTLSSLSPSEDLKKLMMYKHKAYQKSFQQLSWGCIRLLPICLLENRISIFACSMSLTQLRKCHLQPPKHAPQYVDYKQFQGYVGLVTLMTFTHHECVSSKFSTSYQVLLSYYLHCAPIFPPW